MKVWIETAWARTNWDGAAKGGRGREGGLECCKSTRVQGDGLGALDSRI